MHSTTIPTQKAKTASLDGNATPIPKRRKLNDSSEVLRRPFRAPSRIVPLPITAKANTSVGEGEVDLVYEARGKQLLPILLSTASRTSPGRAAPKTGLHRPRQSSRGRTTRQSLGCSRQQEITSAGSESDLLAIAALKNRIKNVRSDIDTLQHASELQTSDERLRLSRLIDKWTHAAQSAAEDLYPVVKARAEGLADNETWNSADDFSACGQASEQEQHVSSDSDDRRCHRYTPERDNSACTSSIVQQNQQRSQETKVCYSKPDERSVLTCMQRFTMELMLRSLHIDLELIRYNAEEEQWSVE